MKIIDEIFENFLNYEYQRTIDGINKYLKEENNGVYFELLLILIKSLNNVGEFDKAFQMINTVNKVWPNKIKKNVLAELYISCHKPELAEDIMRNNKLEEKDYYYLALNLLLNAEYTKAKKWFGYYIEHSKNKILKDKASDYLKEIINYEDKGSFIITNYQTFKNNGNNLETGHVIYANCVKNGITNRPHMVWKVEDGKVYAFSVCKLETTVKDIYLISGENYPSIKSNRYLRGSLEVIDESHVEKVIDKINDRDCEKSLDNIYNGYCVKRFSVKDKFFNEYKENIPISAGDIVLIFDKEERKKNYYYVLDTLEDEKLRLLELEKYNHGYYITDNEIEVSRDDWVIREFISSDQKENLENQLTNKKLLRIKK